MKSKIVVQDMLEIADAGKMIIAGEDERCGRCKILFSTIIAQRMKEWL